MDPNKTQVVVLTRSFRIEGEVDLLPGSRLTDFMNSANEFIVVTQAKVANHEGKEALKSEFVNVHKRNIEIILPAEK